MEFGDADIYGKSKAKSPRSKRKKKGLNRSMSSLALMREERLTKKHGIGGFAVVFCTQQLNARWAQILR